MLGNLDLDHGDDVDLALEGRDRHGVCLLLIFVAGLAHLLVAVELLALELSSRHLLGGLVRLIGEEHQLLLPLDHLGLGRNALHLGFLDVQDVSIFRTKRLAEENFPLYVVVTSYFEKEDLDDFLFAKGMAFGSIGKKAFQIISIKYEEGTPLLD